MYSPLSQKKNKAYKLVSWLLTGRMVLRAFWDTLPRLQFSNLAWIKFSNSFLDQPINFGWHTTKVQGTWAGTYIEIKTQQRLKGSLRQTSRVCSLHSSWLFLPLSCTFQPQASPPTRVRKCPSSCSKAISCSVSRGTQNYATCCPRSESSYFIVLPSFLVFESGRQTYSQIIHREIKVKIPSESLAFSENHGILLPCSCCDKLPQRVVSNDGKLSSHTSGSQGIGRATFPRGPRRKSFLFPPSFGGGGMVSALPGLGPASHGERLENQIPV